LTFSALAGGLVFGFGAAINGGCAYSTMTRLMDGEIRMALSLAGFAIGIVMFLVLIDFEWLMRPTKAIVLTGSLRSSTMIATFLLLFWAVYELARIWRQRARHLRLKDMILSPQYRLSTAALLIGVSSAAIFLLIGAPGYTVTLQNFVVGTVSGGTLPDAARWVLLLSVLVGMLLSTLQRGSFRLEWRPRRSWLRNIFGGALMGLGTAMIPGGNDSLVLYGIPSFSPHALPAFAALIVGTAAGVLAMKHLGGIDMRVVCSNDIYRVEAQPTGSILNSHPPSSQTGSA
jgi:uncharacterized membrane protein YedE/YeeE